MARPNQHVRSWLLERFELEWCVALTDATHNRSVIEVRP
jgi:hypothetical protein